MSGPGGVGSLPSSRLTRILQEKAEALKKKRQGGEALQKEVDEKLLLLERLAIRPPEAAERSAKIKESARRSDWDTVETEARSLLTYLGEVVPSPLEARRRRTTEAVGRLSGMGVPLPEGVSGRLEAMAAAGAGRDWADTAATLVGIEGSLEAAEVQFIEQARARAVAVARWATLSSERFAEFERGLATAVEPAKEGGLLEAMDQLNRFVADGLPEAVARRTQSRDAATEMIAAAKEFGAPTGALDAALRDDADAPADRWPTTVDAVDRGLTELAEALRDRCGQALESLRSSLDATAEFGVDPTAARAAVESAIARLPQAPPLDIAPLLTDARRAAEEPIVSVVAGLLDEVRPRIVEARRLGRDPTDVFAAMNRAREALRLKIYSEALAASQEALDRVGRLTEDLDGARDELGAMDEMAQRFRASGFSTEALDPLLVKARGHLDRAEVDVARQILREAVLAFGRDALQFFRQRWTTLDRIREYARERGFLHPDAEAEISTARGLLDDGKLVEAAESVAKAEVALRTAAAPFVARRVEEMEQGFADIPDEALTSPVRRLLADADVSLRVKEDLPASIESMRRAERDFAAVFAAHASALVELLESEVRVLESMGGASDEVQRQIDEVQQIFNMGDFVKASRASQEIRTRAQQQQLLRSEEAVSHAKLSLVELETMGLDLGRFRSQLEEAQSAARGGRYPEAYQVATRLEESAGRARAGAQAVLEGISRAQDLLGRLRGAGADPTPFYEPLRNARLAYQALDFDGARTLLDGVEQSLRAEEARLDGDRILNETQLLIEDGRRLSAAMDPYQHRLETLRTERATAAPEATRTGAHLLHEELVALLRPILEENLRGLERDLDIARAAGVQVDKILTPLGEARRRVALPLPVGAAALLDQARAEFISTRGFVEHADRVTKRARESLAQADLLHVDVAALRAQMERLEQMLRDRQYARVIELGGPLEREILQVTYQHVSKTLAGFQATVTRLRHEGSNTSIAENLLHQARMALDEGRAVEALQLAAKSENELERVDLQRRLAEGSLEATERAIARAVEEGVVAPSAKEEFDLARAAFQQHAYPDVLEQSMVASDALGVARDGHRRAGDAMRSAERQIAEAADLGAVVTDGAGRLAEAQRHGALGQYAEAIRAAREATEMGRWAIERLFAAPMGELRRQVEAARGERLATELDPLESVVAEAEAALRGREWPHVKQALARGEAASRRLFESVVDGRWREVEAEYARAGDASPAEQARREELRTQLTQLRERRDFGQALKLVRSEAELARRRRQEEIIGRMGAFKDRLWVGERLGVDTTPVMQVFSEARIAVDQGRLDEAENLLGQATRTLEPSVREPFERRLRDLQTEVTFAEEGLHVSVGPVRARVKEVVELASAGHALDAGRLLLKAEEDLNLRKSLHRELLNLHFLIDAALARAHERHLDTTEARQLLAESLRLRDTDYAAALEKARESLKRLQAEGAATTEPAPPPASAPAASAFWPFRRPPSEP